MIGARGSGVILSLVERYSGWLEAILLRCKKSKVVMTKIARVAGKFVMITITFDRGGEFTFHQLLKQINIISYFCDPGCPNQKGLVENRIGKIRYSIESRMSFDTITQPNLDELVRWINDEILRNRGFRPFDKLRSLLRTLLGGQN